MFPLLLSLCGPHDDLDSLTLTSMGIPPYNLHLSRDALDDAFLVLYQGKSLFPCLPRAPYPIRRLTRAEEKRRQPPSPTPPTRCLQPSPSPCSIMRSQMFPPPPPDPNHRPSPPTPLRRIPHPKKDSPPPAFPFPHAFPYRFLSTAAPRPRPCYHFFFVRRPLGTSFP